MGLFGFGKSKIDKRKKDWILESADWSDKGNALAKLGKNEDAIECYNQVIRFNSKDSDAWFNRGNSLANLKKFEEAIACYDKVLSLDSEDLRAWFNRGN